jgi:hypothetical protein
MLYSKIKIRRYRKEQTILMSNLFIIVIVVVVVTKFVTASKVLVAPELLIAYFERGMWMTLVTSFKQIQDATFRQLISKFHNIRPLIQH